MSPSRHLTPDSPRDSIVLELNLSFAFDDDDEGAKSFTADSGTTLNHILYHLRLQNVFCFSPHEHKVVGGGGRKKNLYIPKNLTFNIHVSSKQICVWRHFLGEKASPRKTRNQSRSRERDAESPAGRLVSSSDSALQRRPASASRVPASSSRPLQ